MSAINFQSLTVNDKVVTQQCVSLCIAADNSQIFVKKIANVSYPTYI